MVSKVFDKLSNRCIDQIEKYDILSDSQYGVKSVCTTTNLLTVVADRIARLVACLVYLSCSVWNKKGYTGLLYKLSSYWILVLFLASIFHFSDMNGLGAFERKILLDFTVYILFIKAFVPLLFLILGSFLLPLYINDRLDVICNIGI